VIGVAANVKNNGLATPDEPEYYVVRKHDANTGRSATLLLRSGADSGAVARIAREVRAQVAALDPKLPVAIETMDQRIGRLAERPRFQTVLLGVFAAIGLLLAALGIYGVVSFQVAQRTPEFGVRAALGATPREIAVEALRPVLRWIAAGTLAGAAGTWYAARMLRPMLFRVSEIDPWAIGSALVALLAAALLAAWIPSRRAARIDAVQALRQE
jgi:ABC-type lipoprotein release transport system permease subunit